MASYGVKRATFLLSALSYVNSAVSQTVAASNVVGYIVEENTPITAVSCAVPNFRLYTNSVEGQLFCDATSSYIIGASCTGSSMLFHTTATFNGAETFTSACASGCTSLTVVDQYPSLGVSWLLYDCVENLDMPSPTDILYRTVPFGLPTTSTSEPEASETDTNTGSRTTTSNGPTETNDNPDDSNSGPNVGVIVGAVVGSVVGIALIIAAIFIGIRIGKKKSVAAAAAAAAGGPPNGMDPNNPAYRQSMMPMAGPPGSVQWSSHPPDTRQTSPGMMYPKADGAPVETVYMTPPQDQQMYMVPPQGMPPQQGQPMYMQQGPGPIYMAAPAHPQAELPTGLAAQGWAQSSEHPHSYEMDGSLNHGQGHPTGQPPANGRQ